MTIYIDLIFIENVFMNLNIIYATSIILKKDTKIIKMILGSIVGAAYACIYYITKMEIYSNIILKIILSFFIVYLSFGSKKTKSFFIEVLVFYLTSFTFGGVSFGLIYFINPKNISFQNGVLIGIYPLKIILIGGMISLILIVISAKSIKSKITKKDMNCVVIIKINKNEMALKAIIDSGNFLREPITKNPVIIVEKNALINLIPEKILNNITEIINGKISIEEEYKAKIKLIPFTALGIDSGLLLGIKPDEIVINYQERNKKFNNVVIGLYEKNLSRTKKYNALVGLNLIENF